MRREKIRAGKEKEEAIGVCSLQEVGARASSEDDESDQLRELHYD